MSLRSFLRGITTVGQYETSVGRALNPATIIERLRENLGETKVCHFVEKVKGDFVMEAWGRVILSELVIPDDLDPDWRVLDLVLASRAQN
jgi:hypothetical protein